jgi:hypothetical protein
MYIFVNYIHQIGCIPCYNPNIRHQISAVNTLNVHYIRLFVELRTSEIDIGYFYTYFRASELAHVHQCKWTILRTPPPCTRKPGQVKLKRVPRLSGQQIRYVHIEDLSGHRFSYSCNQGPFGVHSLPITEPVSANCPKTGILEGRNVCPHRIALTIDFPPKAFASDILPLLCY